MHKKCVESSETSSRNNMCIEFQSDFIMMPINNDIIIAKVDMIHAGEMSANVRGKVVFR